jgi:hypothetical protein
MVLKGDLETINLPDILQLLEGAKKTGALSIRRHLEEKRLYFKRGMLVFASSTEEREKLGSVLLSLQYINEDKLEDARQAQTESGRRLGIVLLEKGYISHEELVTALKEQAQRIVTALFEWWGGQFEFFEGMEPVSGDIPVGFRLGGIIMEAARIVDEWSRVYGVIPDLEMVVETNVLGVPGEVKLSKDEWKVIALVDGRRTVAEITSEAPMSDIETCKILAGLVERGLAKCAYVVPVGERARRADMEDGRVSALLSIYNELFTQVSAFVRERATDDAVRLMNETMVTNCKESKSFLRDCWLPLRGGLDRNRIMKNLLVEDPEDRDKWLASSLFRLFQRQLGVTGRILSRPQQAALLQNVETVAKLLLKDKDDDLKGLQVGVDIMHFLNPHSILTYDTKSRE